MFLLSFFKIYGIIGIIKEKNGDKRMKRYTKERYIGSGGIVAREKTISGEYSTHRHEFYEIEYILSGSGEYRIDDNVYEIKAGMLFFMTPFHFHSVSAQDCKVYNIMFSESLCDTNFLVRLLHSDDSPAIDTDGSDTDFWKAVLHEIVSAERDTMYASYLLNSVLGKLASKHLNSDTVAPPIKNAMLYLLHHFRENPTLAQTAEHVGYAPSYFSAVFKQETGFGYKEYLDRLRFDYAKKLIKHSRMPMIQICRESGFDDYPNFIRRFKKRFGVSPANMD